ncbi:MAG: MBL fold metallo-hydrolase, partial [Acidobacteriota bacterium]
RPKMARRWDAKMGSYFCAGPKGLSRRRLLGGSKLLPAIACGVSLRRGEEKTSARTTAGAEPLASAVAVVLGTAQDAGVPQVNCFTDYCAVVRRGAAPPPRVASIGLVDPLAGKRFLIDATPDFVAQVADLLAISIEAAGKGQVEASSSETSGYEPAEALSTRSTTLSGTVHLEDHLQGILLTHAHMGHYTGLVHCGREAAATHLLPVYASSVMSAFLRSNQPWASLIDHRNIRIIELQPGVPVTLTAQLSVTPLAVIHRQELSDTLGFLIKGPDRRLLYVPDADRWDGWPVPFAQWVEASDVALLDGSFYSAKELEHRPQSEVPHPPVAETVKRLSGSARRPEVWFTHLNHTNPLWDPHSQQRSAVEAAGLGVATTGQRLDL